MSKKYNIIYADPPWKYADKRQNPDTDRPVKYGGISYPVMDTKDICALNISEITAPNCILFIWATFPNIKEAFKVIDAWGFKYKTLGFAWIKTNKRQNLNQFSFLPSQQIDTFFGIGSYTKSNCEVCLIGLKGKTSELIINNSVESTIIAPIRRHSQKPDEVRDRIVALCGDVPRIELFARNTTPGWDVWGNEVKKDISLNSHKHPENSQFPGPIKSASYDPQETL